MNKSFAILVTFLLLVGCRTNTEPFVVEENTPMVIASQTTEPFGIEIPGGEFAPLFATGTKVPCTFAKIFTTDTDGQTQIVIAPFRGTNQMAADNHPLGRFQLMGIPPARGGTPRIEVLFTVTERQVLLFARDVTHKRELRVERLK